MSPASLLCRRWDACQLSCQQIAERSRSYLPNGRPGRLARSLPVSKCPVLRCATRHQGHSIVSGGVRGGASGAPGGSGDWLGRGATQGCCPSTARLPPKAALAAHIRTLILAQTRRLLCGHVDPSAQSAARPPINWGFCGFHVTVEPEGQGGTTPALLCQCLPFPAGPSRAGLCCLCALPACDDDEMRLRIPSRACWTAVSVMQTAKRERR